MSKPENKNSPVKTEDIEIDLLTNQFYVAVDLYKHEDSLNWSKVNHFLYITAGLFALLSFAIQNRLGFISNHIDPVILISLVGILASLGFFIALLFGVIYLRNRKQIVIEIDNMLAEKGGMPIIGVNNKMASKFSYKEFSPTMWVLVLFPVTIGLLWLAVLISAILSS